MFDTNSVVIICCSLSGICLIASSTALCYLKRSANKFLANNHPTTNFEISPQNNNMHARLSDSWDSRPSAPPLNSGHYAVVVPQPAPSSLFVRSIGGDWEDAPVIPLGAPDYDAATSSASALSIHMQADAALPFVSVPALFSSEAMQWDTVSRSNFIFPGRSSSECQATEPEPSALLRCKTRINISGCSAASSADEHQVVHLPFLYSALCCP